MLVVPCPFNTSLTISTIAWPMIMLQRCDMFYFAWNFWGTNLIIFSAKNVWNRVILYSNKGKHGEKTPFPRGHGVTSSAFGEEVELLISKYFLSFSWRLFPMMEANFPVEPNIFERTSYEDSRQWLWRFSFVNRQNLMQQPTRLSFVKLWTVIQTLVSGSQTLICRETTLDAQEVFRHEYDKQIVHFRHSLRVTDLCTSNLSLNQEKPWVAAIYRFRRLYSRRKKVKLFRMSKRCPRSFSVIRLCTMHMWSRW